MANTAYVRDLAELRMSDVGSVGGKSASLGELIGNLSAAGVRVPGGFATTADAYRDFLAEGALDKRIAARLQTLNVDDVSALTAAGKEIRGWIVAQPFSDALRDAIASAYDKLTRAAGAEASFAVRSSATAEDLPDA